jgi:hypothetical protein
MSRRPLRMVEEVYIHTCCTTSFLGASLTYLLYQHGRHDRPAQQAGLVQRSLPAVVGQVNEDLERV